MRKSHHRPPSTSLLASKRFVVALCAAVAMVLGAMSVGANSPEDNPGRAPSPLANHASSLAQGSGNLRERAGSENRATPSHPIKSTYATRQAPTILNLKAQPLPASQVIELPMTSNAAKTLEVKLKLKPVDKNVATPTAPLLEAEATVEIPVSDPAGQPGQSEGTPLQGSTDDLPEDETPPPAPSEEDQVSTTF